MVAHRAWKLQYDSCSRGFGSCATLQLRGTLGGPDLTQGAPGAAFGSNFFDGAHDFAKAFDNNPSTFWSSNTGTGTEFVGWDFGLGNSEDIVQFSFLPRPDSFAAGDSPITGGLEWTDGDPSASPTWTRLFSFGPATSWTIGVSQAFPFVPIPLPTARRAWSLVGVTPVGGHAGDGFGLCGHEWKAGGLSLLGSGTLGASSTDGSWSLPQAIDGGTGPGHGWYSGNFGFTNGRIWYDFGAGTPAAPDTVTLCSLNSYPWTIGTQLGIDWTDDDPTASPTWTRDYVIDVSGANDAILSFPTVEPTGVFDSRMSEYLIEGPSPGVYDSRMSEYVLEGSNNKLFVSRASQYIILGPGGNPSQLMLGTF